MTRTMMFAFAAIVSTSFSSTATAGYRHIDELACRIERQSVKLLQEFRSHYSHSPVSRYLIADARNLHRVARHVHEIAQYRGSVRHLRSDVRELDRAFQHLQEVVDSIRHDARCHCSGHVHGRTRHVRKIMRRMDDNIRDLRDEVRELASRCDSRRPTHYRERHVVQRPIPDYPRPPRTYGPSVGVRFGSTGLFWDGNQIRFGR